METAHDMARRLASLPPQAVRLTKRLIRQGAPELAARMEEELALFRERLGSPGGSRGVPGVHGEAQAGLFPVRLTQSSWPAACRLASPAIRGESPSRRVAGTMPGHDDRGVHWSGYSSTKPCGRIRPSGTGVKPFSLSLWAYSHVMWNRKTSGRSVR